MSMQVALVTGAARGIGRQVTTDLAERGYTVLLSAHHSIQARTVAAELGGHGDVRALELDLDVTDRAALEAVPAAVRSATGQLDVLVNNAVERHPAQL